MPTSSNTQRTKLSIALEIRAAMRAYRAGRPLAFQNYWWPRRRVI